MTLAFPAQEPGTWENESLAEFQEADSTAKLQWMPLLLEESSGHRAERKGATDGEEACEDPGTLVTVPVHMIAWQDAKGEEPSLSRAAQIPLKEVS